MKISVEKSKIFK